MKNRNGRAFSIYMPKESEEKLVQMQRDVFMSLGDYPPKSEIVKWAIDQMDTREFLRQKETSHHKRWSDRSDRNGNVRK